MVGPASFRTSCSATTPLANLHVTILDKINAKQESFGDSTGMISGV